MEPKVTRYTLRNDGYSMFKKIMSGAKWIGRVCRKADGTYLGIIGKTEAMASTEREAFNARCRGTT